MRSRSLYILIVIISIFSSTVLSCSAKTETKRMSTEKVQQKANTTQQVQPIQQPQPNENKGNSGKLVAGGKSGAITSVPWENDEGFKKAQEKCGANTLMAAYGTVLRDPLPGEEENVHLAARMLAGTVVNPGQVFSQNGTIGPYTQERGFKKGPTYMGSQLTTTIGGGVCKIASTLYNVSVLSNLQIVERHAHSMPVPYVPYGQDATVAYGARDFKFRNNTDFPILVWAQGIDNILYMGFYGAKAPPRVEWNHEVLNVIDAGKTYRNNTSLPLGTEKLAVEGMDGGTVRSSVTITSPDGNTETKSMGISNYRPFPHVYEKN